jgi:hypothetical protein
MEKIRRVSRRDNLKEERKAGSQRVSCLQAHLDIGQNNPKGGKGPSPKIK